MARWNKIFLIAAALTALLASASCQRELEDSEIDPVEEYNSFCVTAYGYDVDLSLTRAPGESFSQEENDCLFTLTEIPRGQQTRASYDDVDWDAHDSKVGIYLVEHMDDADLNDDSKVKIVASSANLARKGNVINSSSVDLLEQVKFYVPGDAFEGKTVDAYAYFPYAEEITQAVALSNTSNSLIGMFNAADKQNVLHLPFTMKPTQTDDNIWFHDLMISVREEANEFNQFGNIGKKNRSVYSGTSIIGYRDRNDELKTDRGSEITCDNIHMRMQHIFSRFTINIKYDSRFEGSKINQIFVDGSKVFSYGEINLLKGEISPGGASRIDRLISDDIIRKDKDIYTDMMLCPCELDGEGQMVFHIIIDGTEYKCDLYKMMGARSIKSSYIYDLNFSFSRYASLIVNNSYGSTVACVQYNPGEFAKYGTYGERAVFSQNSSGKPLDQVGDILQWVVVAPREGWKFEGIYVNGQMIPFNEGSQEADGSLEHVMDGYRIRDDITSGGGYRQKHYYCKLEEINGKNTRYDIVCVPDGKWYAQPDHIIQHFDGIYNNGFNAVDQEVEGVTAEAVPPTDHTVTIWKDISGHGNDAQLQNIETHTSLKDWRREMYDQTSLGTNGVTYMQYETTRQSGWVEGGLKLDGVNDYVTFPAVLPQRNEDADGNGLGGLEMTMELYVCMERPQPGRFPRIIGEAEPGLMASETALTTYTTHGYPSFVFTTTDADVPSSTNVQHYPRGSNQIYIMGFGHNDGHTGTSSLVSRPDGDKIMHIVLWYSGGWGKVTDMSIFKDTHVQRVIKNDPSKQLGGGDRRNCLVAMVEYWDRSINDIVRKTLSFYGDGDDGLLAYKTLLNTVFGVEELTGADNAKRELNRSLDKDISNQSQHAWLEDPFAPTERWACIGGRPNDYSRQFNGTIFSFMVYDTLLPIADIDHNRNLHFNRFGAYKTDVR